VICALNQKKSLCPVRKITKNGETSVNHLTSIKELYHGETHIYKPLAYLVAPHGQ